MVKKNNEIQYNKKSNRSYKNKRQYENKKNKYDSKNNIRINKHSNKKNDFTNLKNEKDKNKIIFIVILVILIIFISIIIKENNKNKAKIFKVGNNSSSQEIVNNILNISSYESEIDVEVKSNKNSNKYKIKQIYKGPNENSQEVIEPTNIAGVKIIKDGNNLKVENSNLSISKIIENYKDLTQNSLDLNSFIEDYKNDSDSKFKEEKNEILMETTLTKKNQYNKFETLYISKENGKPTRLEIKDSNQNIIIYITYNRIEI